MACFHVRVDYIICGKRLLIINMNKLKYIIFFLCCITSLYSFNKEVIQYSYAGNYKGWVNHPFSTGRHPAIIYNYDHYYDWAGDKVANERGYVLESFMKTFESWGYITFIPVERYRKANAIKGAVKYLLADPRVDPTQIHIVSMGEGAFMSLLVLQDIPQVASITLVAPENVNYTGFFSFPTLLRRLETVNTPMFLLISEDEEFFRLRSQELLDRLLRQEEKEVLVNRYYVEKSWFFNHKHFYMNDIKNFIKSIR